MSGKKVMLAGEMLWVVVTDKKENTHVSNSILGSFIEIPYSDISEVRTENQSILNGSLTAMLKSPVIFHAGNA